MNLKINDLGLVDFKEAWDRQKELFNEVKAGLFEHGLIVCRHNPVITIGRSGDTKNIIASSEELKSKGIDIYKTGRGGDVTYHGPGQLTAYPIFNLNYLKKDVHWFLRYLEGLVILSLDGLGIKTERLSDLTGVWAGKRKIASIGIAVRNWISLHGLSINVKSDDLANFSLIRPCGMDIMVTSVESESGRAVSYEQLKGVLIDLLKASNGRGIK